MRLKGTKTVESARKGPAAEERPDEMVPIKRLSEDDWDAMSSDDAQFLIARRLAKCSRYVRNMRWPRDEKKTKRCLNMLSNDLKTFLQVIAATRTLDSSFWPYDSE